MNSLQRQKFDEIIARAKAKQAALEADHAIRKAKLFEVEVDFTPEQIKIAAWTFKEMAHRMQTPKNAVVVRAHDGKKQLNFDQQRALELALKGVSFCLIGAAGTGKTFCQRVIIEVLRNAGKIPSYSMSTKWLQRGDPAIIVTSFTNKAVYNIAKGMPSDVACRTMHKVIEFEPEFYQAIDAEGNAYTTMRFEPKRNKYNKLPPIALVVIEEGSTISVPLHAQFLDAIPNRPQFIYMGDINQLPPVYGPAILGFKMLDLPVIELREVMRQALDSNVLAFAWDILKGKPMKVEDIKAKYDKEGEFQIQPWKMKLTASNAIHIAGLLMERFLENGQYDPMEDMILMPQGKNKSGESPFCTNELNTAIADTLGRKRKAMVYEIIAGFQKFYVAVGDKLFVRKQEVIVEEIVINGLYQGKIPLEPSLHLNRWGHYDFTEGVDLHKKEFTLDDMEMMMASATFDSGDIEERKNQASHIVKCKFIDSDETVDISTTGDFMEMQFGYALTIHKAQGSEWKKVILLLHHSHNKMLCRELLYTAVTRAKKEIYILCEPDHFKKGVVRQRIKGNTLKEKAEWFKGKKEALDADLDLNFND